MGRMKRSVAARANPEAYLAALDGWQRDRVTALRNAIKSAAPLEARIDWGPLVSFADGPVCLIRAEAQRLRSASGVAGGWTRSSQDWARAASTRWRRCS